MIENVYMIADGEICRRIGELTHRSIRKNHNGRYIKRQSLALNGLQIINENINFMFDDDYFDDDGPMGSSYDYEDYSDYSSAGAPIDKDESCSDLSDLGWYLWVTDGDGKPKKKKKDKRSDLEIDSKSDNRYIIGVCVVLFLLTLLVVSLLGFAFDS
ncbi:MAG: hypothetical protein K2K82_05515 [Muribaculaceae bacterium]|nr:hypothetical protein [Muribaculaceae bacterium]